MITLSFSLDRKAPARLLETTLLCGFKFPKVNFSGNFTVTDRTTQAVTLLHLSEPWSLVAALIQWQHKGLRGRHTHLGMSDLLWLMARQWAAPS